MESSVKRAAGIILRAFDDGIIIELTVGNKVLVKGEKELVKLWLPTLEIYKNQIIALIRNSERVTQLALDRAMATPFRPFQPRQ